MASLKLRDHILSDILGFTHRDVQTIQQQTSDLLVLLDPASGTTMDYAYGQAGIKYTFTPELRGPADQENIEPGWRELWAGVIALIAEIETIEGLR